MTKTAIIFGITGQDGSWLAKFLLDKGYRVVGVMRRLSNPDLQFVEEMRLNGLILEEGDLTDYPSIHKIITHYQPDEVYCLAAQSHVATSFAQPLLTSDVTGNGPVRILDVIKEHSPHTRFYNASSSEMFGDTKDKKQNENTAFKARSPYAAAKIFAYQMTKVYRESYKLFACSGILFNHESERRGKNFVTRKITDHLGQLVNGLKNEPLSLGNIYSMRDFGYAPDYVEAMWLMLQQDEPDDYVIATGETYTVKDFVTAAFEAAHMPIFWEGQGLFEIARFRADDTVAVVIDQAFYRPAEVEYLCGDASKAAKKLGWRPKTSFIELVNKMVDYDIRINSDVYTAYKTYHPEKAQATRTKLRG